MSIDPFQNFKEFSVKSKTSSKMIQKANDRMNPNFLNLFIKYGALFIISIFISLIICPQRGISFIRSDFPIFHHLFHQSEILCGLYCGLVFFTTTHLLTFGLLTHFERLKIIKQFSFVPAVFMSSFFGLSMTSFFSSDAFGVAYSLSWLSIVGISYYTSNYLFTVKLKQF